MTKQEFQKIGREQSNFFNFFYYSLFFSFSFFLFQSLYSKKTNIIFYFSFMLTLSFITLVINGLGQQLLFPQFPFIQNKGFYLGLAILFFFLFKFLKIILMKMILKNLIVPLKEKIFL